MKQIKKLKLNKVKISNLSDVEMINLKGGNFTDANLQSCPCTWQCTQNCQPGYTINDPNCAPKTYPGCPM